MNATEQSHSTAEAAILDELRGAPVPTADLKKRVRSKIRGLKDPEYKGFLEGLVAAHRIHGRLKLGANGRPTKTIEAFVLGPPPPPPPPPREAAPREILKVLAGGSLSATDLKIRIKKTTGISDGEYKAVLLSLTESRQIFGQRARNAAGKLAKTIASYSLNGPPAADFIAPVLTAWKTARAEAIAAGVRDDALVTALLAALGVNAASARQPASSEPTPDDREQVLRSVRRFVEREGSGSLIPIRKLRGSLELPKNRFDTAVLQLYADNAVILHHHDYVGNLSDAERNELVLDKHGNHYIGVALSGEN